MNFVNKNTKGLNKKQLVVLLFLMISLNHFSQTTWYHYKKSGEIRMNPKNWSDEAYRYDINHYKDNIFAGSNYEVFCREAASYLYEDLSKGRIYPGFDGYENYVHKLLEELVKDTAVTNRIKVVFYRDESLNASMSESGLLRLNVGMVARLKNEAELAMLLGHEVAHFLHEDGIRAFAKDSERNFWSGSWSWSWNWAWGTLTFTPSNNLWYNREQEEAADFASLGYIKKSPYSIKAACNLYRLFKRDEIRGEIQNGKRVEMFRTHPDPGDRMKMIKGFTGNAETSDRKKFVVDSLQFQKLREMCFMESVNIGFSQNNLDEVITLLFSRYLLEPENAMNLAALVEAIRRIMILKEEDKIQNKPFILNQYLTQRKEALANYPFLGEKNPSILNYLAKGFVDIWKEDLATVKATDLLDPSVTEFTTYQEAYDYFKKKGKENKMQLVEHYKYFGTTPDFSDVVSYRQINTVFETNDYLAQTLKNTPEKTATILLPLSSYALFKTLGADDIITKKEKFNSEFVAQIKKDHGTDVYSLNDFSFNDQQLVRSLLIICGKELDIVSPNGLIAKSQKNWAESFPEVYSLFEKTKSTTLFVCLPYVASPNTLKGNSKAAVFFYKISLPGRDKYTLAGSEKDWDEEILNSRNLFFENVSKQLGSFAEHTRTK